MAKDQPTRADLLDEVEELKTKLEIAEKRSFFAISDWKDAIKLFGLPLAFCLALYSAYDNVWLRWLGQDEKTIANIVSGLTNLQALDEKTFTKQAVGEDSQAGAVDAARRGQRSRIVSEVFEYWKGSPDFFQRTELDLLAHHLILQGRTKDAVKVIESLVPGARSAFEKADLYLKMGRAYGADGGDANDLDAARTALTKSVQEAENIKARGTRSSTISNVLYYRVFMELQNEQPCPNITPYMTKLQTYSAKGTEAENLLDKQISQLTDIHAHRCGGS